MTHRIYSSFLAAKQHSEKRFVVLIDPDKMRLSNVSNVIDMAVMSKVDYFFVGGSLIVNDMMNYCLDAIKEAAPHIPTILFPSSPQQINEKADAILFLSLISGRNPDFLIGQHVLAAPILRRSSLEIIPTGYMLVDSGAPTTATYISGTLPIPSNKEEIAACTALAGEMLGLKTLYLDAGSGAKRPVPEAMITAVSESVNLPLIVGGGMNTAEKVSMCAQAGANIVVVGNALEKSPSLVAEMSAAVHEAARATQF